MLPQEGTQIGVCKGAHSHTHTHGCTHSSADGYQTLILQNSLPLHLLSMT